MMGVFLRWVDQNGYVAVAECIVVGVLLWTCNSGCVLRECIIVGVFLWMYNSLWFTLDV